MGDQVFKQFLLLLTNRFKRRKQAVCSRCLREFWSMFFLPSCDPRLSTQTIKRVPALWWVQSAVTSLRESLQLWLLPRMFTSTWTTVSSDSAQPLPVQLGSSWDPTGNVIMCFLVRLAKVFRLQNMLYLHNTGQPWTLHHRPPSSAMSATVSW